MDEMKIEEKDARSRLYEFDEDHLRGLRRIAVVGDLHGDSGALGSLLDSVDTKKDGVVFLGDYADRGPDGIEVIDTIRDLMKRSPQNVVALKGNHEDFTGSGVPKFRPCTLISEAETKRESWQEYFQNELEPFIERLYLAAVIRDEVLFVHGGISSKIRTLEDLRHPTRRLEEDILWSDPLDGRGEYPNRRGAGVSFGEDVSMDVCNSLGIKRIIRSHEPRKARSGPHYEHDGRVVTTNCTGVYGSKPFVLIVNPNNPSDVSFYFL